MLDMDIISYQVLKLILDCTLSSIGVNPPGSSGRSRNIGMHALPVYSPSQSTALLQPSFPQPVYSPPPQRSPFTIFSRFDFTIVGAASVATLPTAAPRHSSTEAYFTVFTACSINLHMLILLPNCRRTALIAILLATAAPLWMTSPCNELAMLGLYAVALRLGACASSCGR